MKTKTKSFITKIALLVVCVFMFTAGFLTLGLNNNTLPVLATTGNAITTGNFATTEDVWQGAKTTNLITTPTLPSYNTGDGKDTSKWKSFWNNEMVASGWGSYKISGDDDALQVYATTALDGSDTFAIRPVKSGTFWGGDACLGGADADTVEQRYEGGVSYTVKLSSADQAIANNGYLRTSVKAEIYMQKLIVCYASIKVEFYKADGSLIIQERNVWHSGVFENRYTSRSVSGITVPQETAYIRYWFSNNSVGNVRKAVKNMQAYLQNNTPVATKTHDGITFTAWDKSDSLPTSGNYFLTKDVSLTSAWAPTSDLNLCLSGYKIIQTADSETATVNVASGVTLSVYDCTEAGEITHASGKNGKGVVVKGTLNLHAGKITGNGGASMDSRGGGVLILSGEFNMYGGEISNNSLGGARGAAVSVGNSNNNTASATFNMIGGEIYGNTVGKAIGSAVSVGGATTSGSYLFYFNMTGGKIYGNTTNGAGESVGSADAVAVSKNGRFTMTAGEITENRNGVYVEAGVIILSGTAYIDGNGSQQDIDMGGSCGYNLRLGVPKTDITKEDRYLTIGAGGLTAGASIGVSVVSGHGAQISSGKRYTNNTDYATADSLKYIYSDDSNKKLIYAQYDETNYSIMTETGHNHSDLYFEEWETFNGSVNSGYYYLDSNFTANGNIIVSSGETVNLCLNGYTFDVGEFKIEIASGASFEICDCQQSPFEESGEITGSGETVIDNYGDFSMEGGTVNNTNDQSGDALKNNSSGKFNMNNGSLSSKGGSAFNNDGGTVEASEGATFTSSAGDEIPPHTHEGSGELNAWTATSGTLSEGNYYLTDSNLTALTDNITIAAGTTVTLCLNGNTLDMGSYYITNNGALTICDCQSVSGKIIASNSYTIYNKGTFTLQSGKIENQYRQGIGIYNDDSKAKVTINGGEISCEGTGITNGRGKVTVNAVTMVANDAYAIFNEGTLCVTGGNIKSKTTNAIYTSGYSAEVYLSGSPVIVSENNRAGLYMNNRSNGGTVYAHAENSVSNTFTGTLSVILYKPTDNFVTITKANQAQLSNFSYYDTDYELAYKDGNLVVLHVHNYLVKYDDTNHWNECSCGSVDSTSVKIHSIVNADTDCTTDEKCSCGKVMVAKNASHIYKYTADGVVITETCSVEGCTVHTATATIVKPEGTLTYNGNEFNATVDYSTGWAGGDLTLVYTRDGDIISAGEITASITIGGKTATVTYTIAKANQTAPTGVDKTDTTYIDTTDGKITGVTNAMEYKLSTESDYIAISGTEITNLASGTYFVRFAETDNYNASDCVSVTINKGEKRTATLAFDSQLTLDKHYNGAAVSMSTGDYSYTGDGVITVAWYSDNNGVKGDALLSAPVNVGTYWVCISAAEGDTYKAASEITEKFIISKVQVAKPVENTTTFIYNGAEQVYALTANDNYTILNDKRTNVGKQDVTVGLIDKINYEWADGTNSDLTFTFTIDVKEIAIVWVEDDFTYNGVDQTDSVTAHYVDVNGDEIALTVSAAGAFTDYNQSGYEFTASFANGETNYILPSVVTKTYHIKKVTQVAPGGVYGVNTTYIDLVDGKILGVDESMEYRLDGESDYIAVLGNEISDLPSGKYFVRYAEKANYLASNEVSVTLIKGPKHSASLGFNVVTLDKVYDGNTVSFGESDYTYVGDGEVSINWYDDNGAILTGEPKNAGVYYIGISAIEGDTFLSVNEIKKTVTIAKQQVVIPVADNTAFVYNGAAQTYNVAENENYTITNNVRTNAGIQEVIVALKDTVNYEWTNGFVENIVFDFEIATKDITGAQIVLGETLIYDSQAQTQTIESVTIDGLAVTYTLENNVATDVGSSDYTLTATLAAMNTLLGIS